MYEAFFGFQRKPFELVPDPDFIYLSRSHRKAVTYLDYGIRERAGFLLLTGDVGSGKTTLIRDLVGKKYERVTLAKVFNTRVSSEQLLCMINDDFGLAVAGKDKISLLRELNDFLLAQYAAGNHPILIIDEAQNLGADLLEEVRLLSNLENSSCKLLQIILVGQPELRYTMASPALLQLRQRISVNCHLKALSRDEVEEYILHRMQVAGNREAVRFDAESFDLVFQFSRGIPRLVNIICDFLLLSAFAEETRAVSAEMTREVADDLDFERSYWGAESVPDSRTPSAAHARGVDQALQRIEQRLDAIEEEVFERVSEGLRGMTETLVQIKAELSRQVGRNEEEVARLRQRVEGIPPAADVVPSDELPGRPAASFARRLMDGVSSLSAKK